LGKGEKVVEEGGHESVIVLGESYDFVDLEDVGREGVGGG